jgi:nucleoside-diphosphate-sugar epimerase
MEEGTVKVLVTGSAGYIGSVLCPMLLHDGHEVTAVDHFMYGQRLSLASCCISPKFTLLKGNVRDISFISPIIKDADVIIPLAAVVGMPACEGSPFDAVSTNYHAVQWISSAVSKSQLIIYPNTNSAYGQMPEGSNEPLDENSPMKPLSVYAESKCNAEASVLEHENSLVFRLATVFGVSPRMRTDLLVNDITLRAVRDGGVFVFDPHARRNYIHVRDVADAFCWAIKRQADSGLRLSHRVFNLGHDDSNCTKWELCGKIQEHVPNFYFLTGPGADPDKRDYVISNDRLHRAGFVPKLSLDWGIVELLKLYRTWPSAVMGNV